MSLARRPRWKRPRADASMWSVVGLLPAVALSAASLFKPWAHARVIAVIGISRSPSAVFLVVACAVGLVILTLTAVLRAKRMLLVGILHAALGILMAWVAWAAFQMVREAGSSILGIIRIASVRPGTGPQLFVLAAVLVFMQGVVEIVLAQLKKGRTFRKNPTG